MVFFYGPHGYTLKDPGVYGITTRTIPWLEKCVANRLAQDYELTKFQGRHGKGGETYEFIGKTMHPGHYEAYIEKMFPNPVFRADAMKQVAGKSVAMDVITIRNRRVFSNPTLFSLILALQNRGFNYREIHCSFCRGGLGDANPPSWDYKFNE